MLKFRPTEYAESPIVTYWNTRLFSGLSILADTITIIAEPTIYASTLSVLGCSPINRLATTPPSAYLSGFRAMLRVCAQSIMCKVRYITSRCLSAVVHSSALAESENTISSGSNLITVTIYAR